ncbi:BrnT family toxin [Candidatus Poribacteria bacterium]|nr:BrnT family toxin [Candidatus Poribacteria bacterium]
MFQNRPRIFRLTITAPYGERRYKAHGQTDAGRHLTVFFVPVYPNRAKVISARDMTPAEQRRYRRK